MRRVAFILAFVACLLAPPAADRAVAGDGPLLTWLAADGSARWSIPLSRGAATGPAAGKLAAPPWHKKLPDLDVRLVGGGALGLREARGSVLALTFWATWCEPCRRELPRLQALYEEHRENGLKVVAINVEEALELAVPFAAEMGLEMPIGLFDEAMRPSLFGKTVPALVVADREGNIRGRWDGFEPEFEAEIDGLIQALLAEERLPPRDVAPVLRGAGRFALEWFRETKAPIEDVLVRSDETGGRPSILVSHGVMLALHAPDGATEREWVADRASGSMRLAPPDHPGGWSMAGFRPGARQIVLLPDAGSAARVSDVGTPMFDLVWLPAAYRGEGRALAAATLEGLRLLDETGAVKARPEGFGAVAAVGVAGEQVVVLESAGRLTWVDPSFVALRTADAPPDPFRLVADDTGAVGVASDEATALAHGRLAPGGASAVAAATRSGRLLIVSVADGEILFEAEWPGVGVLAAGDLDGDGVDELVVAVGKSFGVLRAAR